MKNIVDMLIERREREARNFQVIGTNADTINEEQADNLSFDIPDGLAPDQLLQHVQTVSGMMAIAHAIYTPRLRRPRFRRMIAALIEAGCNINGIDKEELADDAAVMDEIAGVLDAALCHLNLLSDGYLIKGVSSPAGILVLGTPKLRERLGADFCGRLFGDPAEPTDDED